MDDYDENEPVDVEEDEEEPEQEQSRIIIKKSKKGEKGKEKGEEKGETDQKDQDDDDEDEDLETVDDDEDEDDDFDDIDGADDKDAESDVQSESGNAVTKGFLPRFDDDEEEEEDEDEHYLQKFDEHVKNDVISNFHPEMQSHNFEEVQSLCTVVRNTDGVIVDPLHRTLPFITKYERARVLGERAKQLNSGAKSFIEVEPSIIDGYLIALKEFEQKKIPFILRRPLPNGGCEYWRLSDLEMI
jgi:DNA-directed RNA polymerase subunit K/omega